MFLRIIQDLEGDHSKTGAKGLLGSKDIHLLFESAKQGRFWQAFSSPPFWNGLVLTFSLDTRIATTGIASAIASSYALVVMLFAMIVYRERLAKNQLFGIAVFMTGLLLLSV